MATPLPGTMIVDGPAQDPWDTAFEAFKQALVDLNGDGVPDAVTSPNGQIQPIDNRMRQAMGRRAMAGRDPSLTAQEMDAVGRRSAISEQNSQAFERGVGEALLGQPVRAVNAVGSAYSDPSLGNVANAGLQAALAATPFMPLRYAAPVIGTDMGLHVSGASQAQAQGSGVEARLRQMSPQELQAYQRSIGVAPDGRIGPQTVAAAQRYEADRQAQAAQAAETDRIRAQGDAAAVQDRARIMAQSEADANRARAASELSAEEAQRPFVQRNPGYSSYAPFIAGAAAAAVPAIGSVLSRRAITTPLRQEARAVDAAAREFNAAPTPMNALTLARTVEHPAQLASQSTAGKVMDYGSIGLGAGLPSGAAVAPYVIDYMQPPGTEARTQAENEFTLDKLRERMVGPFAMGLTLAGAGRFVGDKGAAAFMNPAPRGANMAQAQAVNQLMKGSGTGEELTNNLTNMLRGGQVTALEGKRLNGIWNAEPPNVLFNDIQIGLADSAGRRGGRVLPEPPSRQPGTPADNAGPPQPGSQGAGPTPSPAPPPGPKPSGPSSRPEARRASQETLLDIQEGLLAGKSAQELMQQYGVSADSLKKVARNTQQIVADHGGDAAAALQSMQQYRRIRPNSYGIAAPIAAAGPVNALLSAYRGDEQAY